MSLILAAINGRHAIVASDGAVTATRPDGTSFRLANDQEKSRVLPPGFAVAGTGTPEFLEQLHADCERFYRQRPGRTFDDGVRFITRRIHIWCRDNRARIAQAVGRPGHEAARAATVARPELSEVTVILAGDDERAQRARLVVWSATDKDYEPCEGMQYLASGVGGAYRLLNAAVEAGTPWSEMPRVMAGIIEEVARTYDQVGGIIRVAEIGPRSAPEVAFASTGTVTYKIGPGAWVAAANPQVITRTSADQVVTFKAVHASGQEATQSVTVTALAAAPPTPGTGYFTTVGQSINSVPLDEIQFTWGWSGSSAFFEVYVRYTPNGVVGNWGLAMTTGTGAGSTIIGVPYDLNGGLGPNSLKVEFYVRAITASNSLMIVDSEISSLIYGYN